MAQQLPCDGEGVCMSCRTRAVSETETTWCKTCGTEWHASFLSKPIESLVLTLEWVCPDCCCLNDDNNDGDVVSNDIPLSSSIGESSSHDKNDLVRLMRAIEADSTLNDQQKAKKRQEIMTGKTSDDDDDKKKKKKTTGENDVMDILGDNLICIVCRELPERSVITHFVRCYLLRTPCGHNFCLKCFEKWVRQGKKICPNRCCPLPQSMINNPRINSALVTAIRMAKVAQKNGSRKTVETVYQYVNNQNKPDSIYYRASKKNWKGQCVQWIDLSHFPLVAGIAGQSKHGSQSIVLSGGYADDEDHGECGGRNLSGNKRTNTDQSFDQEFKKSNEALRVSCQKGYRVRVVRSHKEKRSSYAPETGLRYDGIYRIEKCWRKVGIQGFKMCRYLFVRCDNEPAPWTSDEHGDRPKPLPVIQELNGATNVTERTDSPSWDYDDEESCWKWKKPPPSSKTPVQTGNPRKEGKGSRNASLRDQVLEEFKCQLCRQVMSNPLTTPCAHNFCKHCLEAFFVGQSSVRKRSYQGRTLRAQKTIMKCSLCTTDLSEFLQNPQVNRELMEVIKNLQRETEEENDKDWSGETDGPDKLENIAEAAEDDNCDTTDKTPEIEGEAKQINKRLKTEG
ncbi:hypothetical protein MKW98_005410 [Papaver atlanticum]|uniref:RING-type E3 ubiquitin transferase n=1 Tax=Papaver atlanticum TaxID=357466 RepID=A0AAD4RWP3_9MAGN|nr:hypothetical protein MKW98_005410 [Papaver atlanticum]